MKMKSVILGLTILFVIIVVEMDILANIVKMVKATMILITTTIKIVITTIDNTTIEVVVEEVEVEEDIE